MVLMDDSQYIPRMYGKVLRERKEDILGIAIVPPVQIGKSLIASYVDFLKKHYIMYGPIGLVKKILQQINCKIKSKISFSDKVKKMYSIRKIAKDNDIPIFEEKDINSPNFLERMRKMKPDIISFASPQIVKSNLLKIPKKGCINVHSALLPKYRGVYPMFWALLNDEKKVGVTVHYMDKDIDNGKIILQKSFPVEKTDTFESLYNKAITIIPDTYLEALEKIENGEKPLPNKKSESTYFSFPKISDVKKFKNKGKRMI